MTISKDQFGALHGKLFPPGDEPGGFSVSTQTGHVPRSGYMVSQAGTERNIPSPVMHPHEIENYVSSQREALSQPGRYLGGWNNKAGSRVSLDVSENIPGSGPLPRAKAVYEGARHGQEAIFDLNRGEEVPNPYLGLQFPTETHAAIKRQYQAASQEYRP